MTTSEHECAYDTPGAGPCETCLTDVTDETVCHGDGEQHCCCEGPCPDDVETLVRLIEAKVRQYPHQSGPSFGAISWGLSLHELAAHILASDWFRDRLVAAAFPTWRQAMNHADLNARNGL